MNLWPKKPFMWIESRILFVSVPFTWNLPEVKQFLMQKSAAWDDAIVGGPAIDLMPEYLAPLPNIQWWDDFPGILQRINPLATRTTTGCVRSCEFCGIGQRKIEPGGFKELEDWPDLPIVCDNNLLASSFSHFDRVMDRLEKHVGVDFNQGLDSRLMKIYHGIRFARLKSPSIRLSCDSIKAIDQLRTGLETLILNGVKKSWTSCYTLIGFDSGPDEAWNRCEIIQKDTTCLPMWFHELDCLEWNQITPKQASMGWTHKERTRIMRRFYKAKYGGYTK